MKTLNPSFDTEKNKSQNTPVTLYEIDINSTTTIYLAETNVDVPFGGKTYLSFPIRRGEMTQNAEGKIDQITVSASNVSLEMSAFIGNNEMRGNRVKIITMFWDAREDGNAKIESDFFIKSLVVNEAQVDFVCGGKLDILDIKLPRRTYSRYVCNWQYKDANCKYAGGIPDCDKLFNGDNGCRVHDNTLNFGAFPDIPIPTRVIFA